jgi:hypothetical protein
MSDVSYAFAFIVGTFLECVMYGEHPDVQFSHAYSRADPDSTDV